jgi:hypothetical protein
LGWRLYRRSLINENKWRAARFGLDGKLIDLGKKIEVPTEALLVELLEFVDDVVSSSASRDEILYVHEILRRRTGADRQLEGVRETGDLEEVVRYIIEETRNWNSPCLRPLVKTARFEAPNRAIVRSRPIDANTIDVALLDMNHGYANVGHDAIVAIVRDARTSAAHEAARASGTARSRSLVRSAR